MSYRSHNIVLVFALFLQLVIVGCKKDWLEVKPDKSLVVPKDVKDFQALLDNTINSFGQPMNANHSALYDLGTDDFYVSDANLDAANPPVQRQLYLWADKVYEGSVAGANDWVGSYKRIFYTNIVLEGIDKITPISNIDKVAWSQVKAGALFHRAFNHFILSQIFCGVYKDGTANTELGIPLRMTSDINVKSVRASIKQTYDNILEDFKQSAQLFPVETPLNNLYMLRSNKSAAYAMISRVYLTMGNYDSALVYSDKALKLYDKLMDFNNDPNITSSTNPIQRFNSEILFHARATSVQLFGASIRIVDSNLYRSYSVNDRRLDRYFLKNATSGMITFCGSYDGSTSMFWGVAVDEMYITRAECNARLGNLIQAQQDLNALLSKRMRTGFHTPFSSSNASVVLDKILEERRKELCFRGLRWSDLRRLNLETQRSITLKRNYKGQTFTLSPNDIRYVIPIPDEVILLSGMQQNPR